LFRWKSKTQYGSDARKDTIFIVFSVPLSIIGLFSYIVLPLIGMSTGIITVPVLLSLLSFAVMYITPEYNLIAPEWQMASSGFLQNTMDIVVLLDCSGNILNMNNRVSDYLGFSEEDLKGRPVEALSNFAKPTDLKSISFKEKMNITYDQCFISRSGESIPFSVNLTSISDRSGKPAYIVMVAHDMSSMKLLEKEIEERKQNEKQLEYLLTYDTMTGLYNRTYFEAEMERITNEGEYPLAYILCDIDGLKLINDTLGHTNGDRLLIKTAGILSSAAERDTLISRVGGDEFAMVVQSASRFETVQLVERIHRGVDESNRKDPENMLSLSIGYDLSYDKRRDFADVYREAYDRMSREKLTHIQSSRNGLVKTLMNMLEARDTITSEHTERMQHYSESLCRSLGLSKDVTEEVVLLARFHDIGKVGIPDRLLLKNDKLTKEERVEMQRHCNIGQRIAMSSPDLTHISDFILKHHEWWDGGGYPNELKGTQIPIQCRIISIIDAFDAMINDRPYRKAMSREDALRELKSCSGTQFDPMLLDYFLEVSLSDENYTAAVS
ncbi:MAG: diguanylate cyclase, partial [Clostridiales bacterium]|nr:diguanylate cyclase [Clostridiales bacterium]